MNGDSDDLLNKAYDLWNSFKQEILYERRFIINHEVLEFLKLNAEKYTIRIKEDISLYRARIYNGDSGFLRYLDDQVSSPEQVSSLALKARQIRMAMYQPDAREKQESGFWGYNSDDSSVPPNNDDIKGGRANSAFIKYLYTAEDPYTALVEARPYLNSNVSVAEIKVNKAFKIFDFSEESYDKCEGFEANLMHLIMWDFSRPSDSNQKDYIPTQYVAEFIKTLGFDGIKFNSSLHGSGRNITIFSYEKCNPLGSKLYKIEDICFEAKGLAPKNEKNLIHNKLEPYK